ncbi:MAG TPA: large conductance mechanosensitive channel protein MscL [Acidimicrobiales bacterium]|jgi:large conductance mechanosensitive channel|nr:large conductance mechanosensitive channel protein MscL [Acidimicrobiales bacterium]
MLKGFKQFILRGNVVDLAVAVVIGAAFGAVVKALVTDILTPIVAAIFGDPNFSALSFTINGSHFSYGDLIDNAIAFASVAAAIYFFVVAPLNALSARRARGQVPVDEVPEPSPEALLLIEIRDLLARQQGSAKG